MSEGANEPAPVSPLRGVIWCRQVDNEAESPRYVPSPDDFPGLKESIPRMRFVGDLAINQSDTNDYWDPDPSKRFSYYRNLFLFFTGGGKYLCMGRMYLSTEERPRLGIKTLVLDANELFKGHNAAGTLWTWYQAMEGASPQPLPKLTNPPLASQVAQSFTYRGIDAGMPLVLLLSDGWGASADTVFGLLGRIPESMLALSGVLVFPYFIPAAKVNIHVWKKFFPLTLAAFRISSRSTLDQRMRWAEGWTRQELTVVDLSTPGVLPTKGASLLAKTWTDEGQADRWPVLRAQVDGPELDGRLTGDVPLEEGPYRRKELTRISGILEESLNPVKKKASKGTKKAASPALRTPDPVPAPPEEVSGPPPWMAVNRPLRVIKVGVSESDLQKPVPPLAPPSEAAVAITPTLPFTAELSSPPPAELPVSHRPSLTPEEVERIVAERVAEELGHYFTGEKAVFADRFSQIDGLRKELNDLDERLRYFAERTLPLIRKTWTKVGELKQAPAPKGEPTVDSKEVQQVKKELWAELRRMESEFTAHTEEILERMESTLQTQGRIWLTLVREVERLSGQRINAERQARAATEKKGGRGR